MVQQTDLGTNLYVRASATPATDAAYAGNVSSAALAIPGLPPAVPVIDVATDTGSISVSWNAPASNGSPITGYYLIVTPQGGRSSRQSYIKNRLMPERKAMCIFAVRF